MFAWWFRKKKKKVIHAICSELIGTNIKLFWFKAHIGIAQNGLDGGTGVVKISQPVSLQG